MELLGLFLIALLVVLFPKQGLKAIGLCLGAGALLTAALCGVALWSHIDHERQHAEYAATCEAEHQQAVAKQLQEQAAHDFLKPKSDAQIEAEHQARMRQQEWESQGVEERRVDRMRWAFGLDPLPTPPPVSKPTPAPIPVPAKPETLYTSK